MNKLGDMIVILKCMPEIVKQGVLFDKYGFIHVVHPVTHE